jgi:hypothetical protein
MPTGSLPGPYTLGAHHKITQTVHLVTCATGTEAGSATCGGGVATPDSLMRERRTSMEGSLLDPKFLGLRSPPLSDDPTLKVR